MFWLLLLQVFAWTYGYFDVDEINNIKYDIDILDIPVTMAQDSEVVLLASKFGQKYHCSFPDDQQEVDLEEKRKEQIALETGIVELLKPMKDVDCLTLVKGWWTYELCYGVHIRQYHVEDGVAHDSNYLGFYQSDFDWSSINEEQAKTKPYRQRYHSQEYVNGTVCDLTGKLRRSEVRYYCDQHNGDYLSTVDELETCVYTLTVYTSRICDHPYLKPPKRTKAVPISCSPLLTPHEYQEYLKLKDEEALKKEVMLESENQDISSELADGTDTPASSSDTDTPDNEWQDYNIDTAVDALQKLVTQSLTEGLDSVFDGTSRGKKIKITKLKAVKVKQKQIATTIKDTVSKAKGQDSVEDEEVDKDVKSDDSTETAKTTGEVQDESVDDVVVDDDDDDDDVGDVEELTILNEFDEGLDKIAKSYKHLEEIKQYKEEIQQEMNAQFAEIIREAEEELNDAGFQEQVDRDTVLKKMSETLDKLLKRLEGKEGTGNKKKLTSMIDKAATEALKRLKSDSSSESDGVQEHVVNVQDNTGDIGDNNEEQVMTKDSEEDDKNEGEVKEHDQTKKRYFKFPYSSDEDDDEDEAVSMEYEINYGDNKPVGVESDQIEVGTVPTADQLNEGGQSLEDQEHSIDSDPDSERDGDVPDPREDEPRSVHVAKTKQPEDGEETLVYNNDIKITVKARHYTEEVDTEDGSQRKSSEVRDHEKVSLEELDQDDQAKVTGKDRTALLRNAEKRVQEAVERKLSESGVKTSGQTIQVKIFTTDDYINGDGETSLFHTNGVLNKMLVAVLGSNTEEMEEAKRQNKLNTNYGFVWKKARAKKQTSKPDNH